MKILPHIPLSLCAALLCAPVFATGEGNARLEANACYLVAPSHGLITGQMSRREKKKYEKRKQPVPTPPAITMKGSVGAENEFAIDATQEGYGVYSVILNIYQRDNYDLPRVRVDTLSCSRRLVFAQPVDRSVTGRVRFRSYQALGIATAPVDTAFAYRLPCPPDKREVRCACRVIGDWQTTLFELAPGEGVYCARDGQVVKIFEGAKTPFPGPVTLVVQHSDGSLAWYGGLETRLPAEGDRVEAGAALGMIHTGADRRSDVYFAVRYPRVENSTAQPGDKIFRNCDLDPYFDTTAGVVRLRRGMRYTPAPAPPKLRRTIM